MDRESRTVSDLIWLTIWLMAVLVSIISVTFIVKSMVRRQVQSKCILGPIDKGPGVIVVFEDDDDETVSEESESDYPSDLM